MGVVPVKTVNARRKKGDGFWSGLWDRFRSSFWAGLWIKFQDGCQSIFRGNFWQKFSKFSAFKLPKKSTKANLSRSSAKVVALPVIGSGRLSRLSRLGIGVGIGSSGQRQRWPLLIGILVILALLPAFLFYNWLAPEAEAGWFDTSYSFRQRVPVGNSSGENKTDFQVKITLDTASLIASGKLQSDCQDIRVTDINGKVLPYWIEPNTCDTTETLVWTKAPKISTSGTDLYVYYGNPSASSTADTQKVFIRDMESAVVAWPMQEEASTTLSYAEAKHPSDSEGRDIVINGGFDTDSSWNKGDGWSISDGVASSDGSQSTDSDIYQTVLNPGDNYELTFTISNYSSGSIRPVIGGRGGAFYSSNGTHTENFTDLPSTVLRLRADADFVGSIDNVSVKQIDIPSSADFDGSELLTDGDMEAEDTSAWTPRVSASLSKETTSPHGGTNLLRVAHGGADGNVGVGQTILTAGKRYRATGYVKSDGVSTPRVWETSIKWTGTTSTDWQYFDVEFVAQSTVFVVYDGMVAGEYLEVDDVSVTEISPLSGSIPTAASGNRPTLGADSTSGHLSNAYTFDGSNDYVDIYSSDLNSVFNPDEGTLVAWAKVSDSSVWSDGAADWIVNMRVDSNNIVQFFENNGNLYTSYYAGGTQKSISHATTTTEWFQVVLTWNASSDEAKFYFNGSQQGSTQTGLGTWIGNLSSTQSVIGALNNSGNSSWSGDINDVRLYNRALSADEIADLYSASTDIQAYYTDNYEGRELIRKYDDNNITVGSLGSEEVGPGPVAYWKFDEGQGQTANDSTSNNNDGTLGATSGSESSDPTWTSEDSCISGKCLEFDGVDDYATTYDFSRSTEDYSISTWIKTNGFINEQAILGKTPYEYSLGINTSGSLVYYHWNATGAAIVYLTNPTSLSPNQWYFIQITKDSTSAKMYINGNLVATDTSTSGELVNRTNTLDIGRSYVNFTGSATRYFDGFIDEVKIYPYARSAEQIKVDYNQYAAKLGVADQGNLSDGLVGYWSMDESSGTTVADKSGNGNHGTLTNAQENGTSDGSGNTTTTLIDTDGTLSSTNDAYNGMVLSITDDATCPLSANAERIISDYDGTTKTFTVSAAFSAAPDTCNYTVLHQVGGKFGNGIEFDGEDEFVDIPATIGGAMDPDIVTVSAWVKIDNSGSDAQRIFHRSSGTYGLYVSSQYYLFYVDTRDSGASGDWKSVSSASIGTLTQGVWTHVVGMYDGSEIKIFINGVEVGSNSLSGEIDDGSTSANIGKGGSAEFFDGNIDEVRVYNRALSPAEVQQLYQWAPGPVGYWDFNEGSGDTAFDKSGNGYHGTLNDSPSWTQGKYGGGIEFDGTNNRSVDITGASANSLELNHESITLSAWVKPRVNGVSSGIVRKGQGTMRSGYGYMITSGNQVMMIYSDTYDSGDHRASFGSTNADEWIYITQVIDKENNIAKGYINGIYQTSMSIAGIASVNSGHSFVIGEDNAYDANAVIDEVKIYNYARTAEQIRQDMVGSGQASSVGGGPLPKPVAHWSFDEQGGQTAHDSIADNDGTLGVDVNVGSDDPTWKTGSECKLGGCLGFDGDDDVVNVSSNIFSIGTNDATVSLWAKISEAGTNNRLFGTPGGYGYDVWIKSNGYLSALGGDKASSRVFADSNTAYDDDSWHHVVAVFDRDYAISLYVDGVLQDDVETGFNSYSNIDYNFTTATIGNLLSPGWGPVGLIDEVKIYNSVLTAEQIRLDMNSGSPLVFGGSGAVSEAADLADGAGDPPVAEWRFDEGVSSTLGDTSGNNNNATLLDGTWESGCKQGKCLYFNGQLGNRAASDQNIVFSGDFTAEMWFKTDTSQTKVLMGNRGGGVVNSGFTIYVNSNNTITATYGNGTIRATNLYPSIAYADDKWHHLAMRVQRTSVQLNELYLDGKLIANNTGTVSGNVGTEGLVGIGDYAGGGFPFQGYIDHIRLYDYARQPSQIIYNYNRGEPIAHYKFDECEGNTVHDSSDNENHGTLTVTTSGGNTAGIGTCSVNNSAWGSGSEGKFGSSLNFDGDGDYVANASTVWPALNTISVSAWFKKSSGNSGTIFSKDMAGFSPTAFDLAVDDRIRLTTYTGGCTYPDNRTDVSGVKTGLNDNSWHHVVALYNGTDLLIFVDGKLDKTQAATTTGEVCNAYNGWSIGARRISGLGSFFLGLIDEVQIFNYALSPAQVRKLYNGGAAIRFGE